MREIAGKCPHCEYSGHVGELCQERVCVRKGYHFIPLRYFEELKDKPFHSRDQHIGLVLGDYLVVGEVGKGGFGKVYLALQLPVLMKAALKLMIRGASDAATAATLLKKFEGEAISLARLNHPNIVRLLKYGTFIDMPYIVMEYVDGGRTLKQEVTERVFIGDGFETETSRHIIDQILNALESAHVGKIIHRDIKPENIMLQQVAGDKYFVRILDFGLSKFVEERTQTSMVVGTPTYMAPEQITGKNIGPWTDLYAVGVITFEMLTGRRPFSGKSRQELFARKLDPNYNPLERISDCHYPQIVLDFFRKAVSRDIETRFQDVQEYKAGVKAVFRELEKSERLSISSSDLAQLLDSHELLQLTVVRKRLAEEQSRITAEKQQLQNERGSNSQSAPRTQAAQDLHGSGAQRLVASQEVSLDASDALDNHPSTVAFRRSSSDMGPSPAHVSGADFDDDVTRMDASGPISSSMIARAGKRRLATWKLAVPALLVVAAVAGIVAYPRMTDKGTGELTGETTQRGVITTRPGPKLRNTVKSPLIADNRGTPPSRKVPAPKATKGTDTGKPRPNRPKPEARRIIEISFKTIPSGARVQDIQSGAILCAKTPCVGIQLPLRNAMTVVLLQLNGHVAKQVKVQFDRSFEYFETLEKRELPKPVVVTAPDAKINATKRLKRKKRRRPYTVRNKKPKKKVTKSDTKQKLPKKGITFNP